MGVLCKRCFMYVLFFVFRSVRMLRASRPRCRTVRSYACQRLANAALLAHPAFLAAALVPFFRPTSVAMYILWALHDACTRIYDLPLSRIVHHLLAISFPSAAPLGRSVPIVYCHGLVMCCIIRLDPQTMDWIASLHRNDRIFF